MPKSVEAELQKTHKSDSKKVSRPPRSTIEAIVESELRCCDVLCISKDEEDELIRFSWGEKRNQSVANIAGIHTTTTLLPGKLSIPGQLFGIGSSGSRCAFIGRSDPQDPFGVQSSALAPYVVHSLSEKESFRAAENSFTLIAANTQQASDFSIIAHRIAELAACPGRVITILDPGFVDYARFHEIELEKIRSYLGFPADLIETPTDRQRSLLGETRRRIPVASESQAGDSALKWDGLLKDLPQLVSRSMDEFKELTGRSYGLVESRNMEDADTVIISPARTYTWLENHLMEIDASGEHKVGLLRPVLNFPFPASQITKQIKGKTCIILDLPSPMHANDSLFQWIQFGIDKAMTNGAHRMKNKNAMPFEDYPIYANAKDWPRVYQCDPSDLHYPKAVIEMITEIKKNPPVSITVTMSQGKQTKTGAATKPGSVHLIYASTDCYASGKHLSSVLLKYFGLHIRQFGKPHDELTHLLLSPRPIREKEPRVSADLLFCPDARFKGVKTGLSQLQDKGVVVFRGDPKNPSEVWQTLTKDCRSIISQKEISLFILASDHKTDTDNDSPLDWTVETLMGGFVEIATRRQFAGTSRGSRQNAFDSMSSNGDLNSLLALKKAMNEIQEFDYSSHEIETADLRNEEVVLRKAAMSEPDDDQQKRNDLLRELLEFYLNGGDFAKQGRKFNLIPVHYHQYRHFASIRHDYPVCIDLAASEKPVVPLVQVMDEIIEHLVSEEGDSEQIRHELLRVETAIRTILLKEPGGELSRVWDEAVNAVSPESTSSDTKKKIIDQKLIQAKDLFAAGVQVFNCNKSSTLSIFEAICLHRFSQKVSEFLLKLDEVIVRLSDILRLDFEQSPHGKRSDELQASVGTSFVQELDFDSMSEILKNASQGEPLPEERRIRIQKSLEIIRRAKPLLAPNRIDDDRTPTSRCDVALGKFYAQIHAISQLFLALRIAELELENTYKPEKHDKLFAEFGLENLTDDELAVCPPFLVVLESEALDESNKNILIDILRTGYPIKILSIVKNICSPERTPFEPISFSEWGNKSGRIAMALNSAFVLQTTASNLKHLVSGIRDGIDFNGPAFFSIYCGSTEYHPRLNGYLIPASALDSRAFPAFTYNPGAGEYWAERFNLNDNTQLECDFPVNPIKYRLPGGEQEVVEVPFTLLDFLASDIRFNKYFRSIPDEFEHPALVPFSEYTGLDEKSRTEKIPFVMMAHESGVIYRVITTVELVNAAMLVLSDWHNLRELGGVDNSYAKVLLENEKILWEDDKIREIQAIRERHNQEFSKAIDEVANELISNIASGLLGLSSSQSEQAEIRPFPLEESVPEQKITEPETSENLEEGKTEAPVVEDDEDESVSFDDPYIETPRCTTCNECTDINSLMFAYNADKQAYVKDPAAGTYRQLVEAAEKCPVSIIHPGNPRNPDEPGLDELIQRAEPYL